MRRSSRILCFLIAATAVTAAAAGAEARGFRGGVGLGGGGLRLGGGAHFGGLPAVGGRGAFRSGLRLGVQPGFARGGFGRFGRRRGLGRFGFGGYGLGGYGFGSYGFSGPDLPLGGGEQLPDAGGYGGPSSPTYIPVVLPPPVCPLIISVGRGLRHPAHTKVVYGRQPACRN